MNILGTTFAALLNSLWQSTVIALLVWAAPRFLPRIHVNINAATRCAVWWAVLAAVTLLPIAPQTVKPIRAPVAIASPTVPTPIPVTLEPLAPAPIASTPAPARTMVLFK